MASKLRELNLKYVSNQVLELRKLAGNRNDKVLDNALNYAENMEVLIEFPKSQIKQWFSDRLEFYVGQRAYRQICGEDELTGLKWEELQNENVK